MPREKKFLEPKPTKEQLLIRRANKGGLGEALVGMKPGEKRTGFLGGGGMENPVSIQPEQLSDDEKARKHVIQDLLARVIIPNSLSSKSNPDIDKKSLVSKLRKQTLGELNRLLPENLKMIGTDRLQSLLEGTEEVGDGDKAEIQDLYAEISP